MSCSRSCHTIILPTILIPDILVVIPLLLVNGHDEPLDHGNIVPLPWTSPRPHPMSTITIPLIPNQPNPPGIIVPPPRQLQHLPDIPTAHRDGLAPMRYRLMRQLARVAHEGVILDADTLKAVLGMRAAVGAGCVGGEAGELFYHLFLYFIVVVF